MVVSEECEAREEEQSIMDSITIEELLTEKMELSRYGLIILKLCKYWAQDRYQNGSNNIP